MNRILSFFLFLSMIFSCLLSLSACKGNGGEDPSPDPNPPAEEEKAPALYLPTAGSFEGHSKEDFSTLAYSAPNIKDLTDALTLAANRLTSDETSYETALATVAAAEQLYANYTSMLAYAKVFYSENTKDSYFSAEYKRLYTALPSVSLAMEKLFSAVCASVHGEALAKTEYFASDIVERYKNGGIYNGDTLPLFERENELLLEAEAISPDTITITYSNLTDTVTKVLETVANIFGESSAEYQQAALRCNRLYSIAANKKNAEIYLSLLTVRREIADLCGYESYAHLSADRLGYTLGKEEAYDMLSAVENYLLPVYQALSSIDYFSTNASKVEKIKYPEQMLNTLTRLYETYGGKLFEGYNYLLHHSLFSIGSAGGTRTMGAFTAYFSNRAQPYFFIGAGGSAEDYMTAAEALGTAIYYYHANEKGGAMNELMRSPELADAYGLSLRLLTLQAMKAALSTSESAMADSSYLILLKSEMYNALQIVLTQCMRTQIEWEAYALSADEISLEALNAIVVRAAERFGCFEMQDGAPIALSLSTEGLLDHDMFASPTISLSDLTSAYVALNLFIREATEAGTGFAALQSLYAMDDETAYKEVLNALSIPLPTSAEDVRTISANLYELLTGYAYNTTTVPMISHKSA